MTINEWTLEEAKDSYNKRKKFKIQTCTQCKFLRTRTVGIGHTLVTCVVKEKYIPFKITGLVCKYFTHRK